MKNLSYYFLEGGEVRNYRLVQKKENSHILQSASCIKFKTWILTNWLNIGILFIPTFIFVCLEPLSWIQSSRMCYRKGLKQVAAGGRDRGSPASSSQYCTRENPAASCAGAAPSSPHPPREARLRHKLALSLAYSISWCHPHSPSLCTI